MKAETEAEISQTPLTKQEEERVEQSRFTQRFGCCLCWSLLTYPCVGQLRETISGAISKGKFNDTQFTWHPFQPFRVYNSLIFAVFTELCNHHNNLSVEHSHYLKKKLYPPWPTLAVTCPYLS